MISVLILTKNEEKDLPTCLRSVAWCDDIHVFDSYSEDQTVEIANQAGVQVTQRHFDGYASQRNAALRSVRYKHSWLLILDADERVPPALTAEIRQVVQCVPDTVDGFRIRRRDYLGTTWLKHAQLSPYYIRLVRREKAYYHREVNEVIQVEGVVESLKEHFNHYPFSKGINHWIDKHNRYSSMEAVQWIEDHRQKTRFNLRKALLSRDFNERRYHQKGIFYRIPGRPIIKWIYIVLVRRAFLDGRAGLTYATLQAIYEYFIVIKAKELADDTP